MRRVLVTGWLELDDDDSIERHDEALFELHGFSSFAITEHDPRDADYLVFNHAVAHLQTIKDAVLDPDTYYPDSMREDNGSAMIQFDWERQDES